MSGGTRTLFYGLVGIAIALAASFVLHEEHQRRTRAPREDAAEKTPAPPRGRPPAPAKVTDSDRL